MNACVAELPPVKYTTSRLEIAPDFEQPVCAGSIALLDGHVARVERLLELPLSGERIRVYWLTGNVEQYCAIEHVSGCAHGRTVYSDWTSLHHELVHAVAWSMGSTDRMLAEGVAVAFDGSDHGFGVWRPDVLLGGNVWDDLDYATAGRFVRFLYEKHGIEPLAITYRSLDRNESHAAVERAFELAYGRTFAGLEREYYDEAPAVYPGIGYCDHPMLDWHGDVWRHTISLACDGAATRGPVFDAGTLFMYTVVTLELARGGVYELDVEGVEFVDMSPCLREPADVISSTGLTASNSQIGMGSLGPGTYRVVLWTTYDPAMPTEARVELRPKLSDVPVDPTQLP